MLIIVIIVNYIAMLRTINAFFPFILKTSLTGSYVYLDLKMTKPRLEDFFILHAAMPIAKAKGELWSCFVLFCLVCKCFLLFCVFWFG